MRKLGCVSQDAEPPESVSISDQLDEYDSQELHCVKQLSEKIKVRRSEKFKLRTDLQEETERQERCARGDAWKLAKNIF